MYTDRAGQCAAMPGGSGSLESTGTVFKLQCTDPEQPAGKMPPAPKGTVKYELAGTGFSLQQKAEKQPIVSGKISSEIPSERYFSRMRQAEAKYRAQRCMPFGFCKESAWEKEQRGEGGLEEEDYLFRQPGGDSRVPGTFTFRFKKILQEGDLPDNLNVHSLRHTNASMLIAQGVDVRTVAGLLGHAQPSTTLDIYSHTFDKNKKLAQQKLAEAMGL